MSQAKKSKWISGWIIGNQAILESPLSYEAWENFGFRTVFKEWFELGEKRDMRLLGSSTPFGDSPRQRWACC